MLRGLPGERLHMLVYSQRLVSLALILFVLCLPAPTQASANSEVTNSSTASTVGSNALFIPVDMPSDSLMTAAGHAPYNIQRTRYARLNFAVLAQAAASQNLGRVFYDSGIILDLFDGLTYTAFNTSIDVRPTGDEGYVWVGTIPDVPFSDVILVVGDGVFSGQIISPVGNYVFSSVSADVVAIHEIEAGSPPGMLADDALIADKSLVSPNRANGTLNQPYSDDGSVIDVMIVYTQNARNRAGSMKAVRANIDNTVMLTNAIYAQGKIDLRLRLVYTAEVNYDDSGGMLQSLLHVRARQGDDDDPDGLMDEVHRWRDQYDADLVALITAGPDGCGIAWVLMAMDDAIWSSNYGFSVTDSMCLMGGTTFQHELGHNLGGAHDRANSGGTHIYDYAYGYQEPNKTFVTIMAYSSGGVCSTPGGSGYCARIARYSSPYQSYNGLKLGSLQPPTNMVRTINNTRAFVANYRQSKTYTLSEFRLISPANDFIATDPALTFEWERHPHADIYKLQITDKSGATVFTRNVSADACDITCKFPAPPAPDWKPPVNKKLKWTVTARKTLNDATYQARPIRTIIPRFLPASIALTSPIANAPITSRFITFEWQDNTRIDQYQIVITDPAKKLKKIGWSPRGNFSCDGTTCSATVDMAAFSTPAPKGTYRWQVLGRRDEAAGSTKSVRRSFMANFYPTPIMLNSPVEAEIVDTKTPTFIWDEADGIEQYRVIVRRVSDGKLYLSPWADTETICVSDVCTLNTLNVPTGALKWEVWGRIPKLSGAAKSLKSGFKVKLIPAP